jgi:hypothetical protein
MIPDTKPSKEKKEGEPEIKPLPKDPPVSIPPEIKPEPEKEGPYISPPENEPMPDIEIEPEQY